MTLWDLVGAMVRRWWVVLTGVALTALALVQIHGVGSVYVSQVDLVLLPPEAPTVNALAATPPSLIVAAKVVQDSVTASSAAPEPVSGVSILGQGVRQGWAVRMRNVGGQWTTAYDQAVLEVQVDGPTPAYVDTTMREVLEELKVDLARRQQAQGVKPASMIRTRESPGTIDIYAAAGSPTRALAGATMLGALGTCAGCVLVDRLLAHRRLRATRRSRGRLAMPALE